MYCFLPKIDIAQTGEGAYFQMCAVHLKYTCKPPPLMIALLLSVSQSIYMYICYTHLSIYRVFTLSLQHWNQVVPSHYKPSTIVAKINEPSTIVVKANSQGHHCDQQTFYALAITESWYVRKTNCPDCKKQCPRQSSVIQFCWQYNSRSIGYSKATVYIELHRASYTGFSFTFTHAAFLQLL